MGAAGRVFGNGYQSQLFHVFFVYALRFEVCHQGIVVGGKAQAEFFEGFGRKAALFCEVFQPGSAVRHTQFAFKKGAGGFHNFIEGFALVFFIFVFGRKLRNLQTGLLRENMLTKSVTYNWHDSDTSYMEAVISRGDRRRCRVIETAWRKGEHLSAWEEYFSLDRWREAFEECGLDPHFYANRKREKDELLPWAMISSGVTEQYLWREHERCYQSVTTPDCRPHCNGCGANLLLGWPCDV